MILDGKECSAKIREKLKVEINSFPSTPKVVDIQIGNNEASDIYIKSKEKACKDTLIDFECIRFPDNTDEKEIMNKILELNNDANINGILIQSPIPNKYNYKKLVNLIDPSKDVDGLNIVNIGKLFNNKKGIVSCTPLGIIKLLECNNITIEGKNVVIVGRSNLVGKPLISLFLNKNATVTICHSYTNDLSNYTKKADILVVAVGKKYLITKDMVKDGAVIVDVGINRIDNKIYGDVDFDNVSNIASYITPVPGGVGPMTVSMLMYNVVECYKMQKFY